MAELGAVLDQGEGLKFFDHARGRGAWQRFLVDLELIDNDLVIAAADQTFSLELCIACWEHDWNHNGRVDDRDRKLFEVESVPEGDPRRRPTYRFDIGDIYWARAMIAFQRAAVEIILAYRWSELDRLLSGHDIGKLTIKLTDAGRVQKARELVIEGLGFSEQERKAYLAETDDDREWVPNPRQKNYAMPLEVDAELYTQWGAILGDMQRILGSQEGISLREAATLLLGDSELKMVPGAYLDLGAMLRSPTDIVLDLSDEHPDTSSYERLLRGLLGHGYAESMRASPLVGRMRPMKDQLDRGEDTLDHKLRYLLWVN